MKFIHIDRLCGIIGRRNDVAYWNFMYSRNMFFDNCVNDDLIDFIE